MDWTPEPSTDRLSLTMGMCVATAWPSTRHGYAAKVMFRGMATAQYGFTTLEDAQAWCLTKLAELRVTGQCASVIPPPDDAWPADGEPVSKSRS